MLFLNLLNRLFGTGSTLNRKEIDAYVTDEKGLDKQAIEEKAMQSEFETEALEGFSASNLSTAAMAGMDRKFAPKSNFGMYAGVVAGIAILGVSSVLLINKPSEEISATVITEIEEEKTERATSEEIEILVQVEEKVEIQPKKLKEEQTKIHAAVETTTTVEQEIILPEIPKLPALPIDEVETEAKPVLIIEQLGKEIYLSNLKLLDYTEYRKAPLKVEKYVLSGTSADKETKTSEGVQMELVETDIAYIDYIEKSIAYFEKGRYKKALDRFEVILKNYKNDLNANFYGALCYHNLGKNDKAIELLNSTLKNEWDNFDQEANWFIATIYLEDGEMTLATAKLKEIVARRGFYAEQAAELLEK